MKLKDFKKEVSKEVDNIEICEMSEEVKNKANIVSLNEEEKPSFRFGRRQAFVLSFCSLAVILIVLAGVAIFSNPNHSTVLSDSIARPVGTKANLKKMTAEKHSFELSSIFDFFSPKNGAAMETAPDGSNWLIADEGANGNEASYQGKPEGSSSTISQVAGIQESEIVKCDENHIYYAYHDTIQIYNVNNGKTELIKTIKINNCLYSGSGFISDNYYTPIEMYLTDTRLIIMYEEVSYNNNNRYVYSNYWYGFVSRSVKTILSIYDKEDFSLLKEIDVQGNKVDGRVYNDFIYFVTSDSISNNKIDDITIKDSNDEEKVDFDLNDVLYVPSFYDGPYENYICSVNINTLDYNFECQLGSSSYSTIYMSENALYLCSDSYDSNPEEIIYKYQLDENNYLKYASCGKVPGTIKDQYSLDEYNGYLRIVTSGRFYDENSQDPSWGRGEIRNAIYVLEEKETVGGKTLEIVGRLEEGIGYPGEQVKSVKFEKEYVKIVTYYQTDPLYLIKFIDDVTIQIVDYLKVPGYSTYLLDIYINNEHYNIGLGLTDDREGKLSLYKEDNETTKQIGEDYIIHTTISESGNDKFYQYLYVDIPALYNIRTMFMYEHDGNTFIGLNLDINICYEDYQTHNYEYKQEGSYVVVKVNTVNGFDEVAKLKANSSSARMVAIGDYFYLVSLYQADGYIYNAQTEKFDKVQ